MHINITDARPCTPAELMSSVSGVSEEGFLMALSAASAILEVIENDAPLLNRLATSLLADTFTRTQQKFVGSFSIEAMKYLYRMANGVLLRPDEEKISKAELHQHNRKMIIRMYANHEAYLGPILHSLGRANILLSNILPSVLRNRPNPLHAFKHEKGIEFEEVRAIFLGSYSWMLTQGKRRTPGIFNQSLFSLTTNPTRNWYLLNRYAKTREEFRILQEQRVEYGYKDEYDFRYAYSALRDYPFLHMANGDLIVPVVRNLALSFCDGIFDFLAVHSLTQKSGSQFDDIFGDVAEEYVSQRVGRTLGPEKFKKLPELGDGQLSPDGIVIGGECIVEVKGKRLPRGIYTTGKVETAKYFLDGKRGRGFAQLLSEAQRVRRGHSRGLYQGTIERTALCLITPDGFPGIHLAPIRRYIFELIGVYLKEKFPSLLDEFNRSMDMLFWLSFEEFDYLCRASAVSHCSIGRLLDRYSLESSNLHPADPVQRRLAPNLREWLLSRYPTVNKDPWLSESAENVMDECAGQLFGRSVALTEDASL